jgi:hypothetical protein
MLIWCSSAAELEPHCYKEQLIKLVLPELVKAARIRIQFDIEHKIKFTQRNELRCILQIIYSVNPNMKYDYTRGRA